MRAGGGARPSPCSLSASCPSPARGEGSASQASAAKVLFGAVLSSSSSLTTNHQPLATHFVRSVSAAQTLCVFGCRCRATGNGRPVLDSFYAKSLAGYAAVTTLGCFGARPGGSGSEVTATSFSAPFRTSARLGCFARQVFQQTRPFRSTSKYRESLLIELNPENECIRADKCATRPSPITTRTPWVGPLTPCCHSLRPVG